MEEEPKGLSLSLDDMIAKQRDDHKRPRSTGGPYRSTGGSSGGPHKRYDGYQQPGSRFSDRPHYPGQQRRQDGGGGRSHSGGTTRRPPPDPTRYRRDQQCYVEEETGTVVFKYKAIELIRVTPGGDITINAEGNYTNVVLASLNDALSPISIRVAVPGGDVSTGEWSITDGKSLVRYRDGVILHGKGQLERARQLLDAFNSPNRLFAAAATAASNAAASQEGILPHTGFAPPGRPGPTRTTPGGGSVFDRLGSGNRIDDRERRLQRQGRYNPY